MRDHDEVTRSETEAVQPFEPLVTERLVIRTPAPEDLDALVVRRNDPEVARYQDWETPYPRERSQQRLDASIAQGGLANETWWMATVVLRESGLPIGDMAININSAWRASEVGYSFDPAVWGRGYASEALHAVLNHLFDDRGIQRVSATLHPANIASAMLLERAGFTYEGQTKLSFWLNDEPDADNTDDMLYGVTRQDRRAWLARPTEPADDVALVEINHENLREVTRLVTHKSQERLVAPVVYSFANALFPEPDDGHPVVPRMWAIQADGEMAGFVMIEDLTEHHAEPYLWRLLIDRRCQRRGIGGRAIDLVEDYCRSAGASTIAVSWEEGPGSPGPFYLARGYALTGERSEGEVEARKTL